MTQIDGTGEPNLFQETHALFTREMPSKNQGETGRGLREQYEERLDSTGPSVYAGMIHQNYPAAVGSMLLEFFSQDKSAAEVDQMELLSKLADNLSSNDILNTDSTDFASHLADRVGPEITSTHLVTTAQQTVMSRKFQRSKFDTTFPNHLMSSKRSLVKLEEQRIKNRRLDAVNGHVVVDKWEENVLFMWTPAGRTMRKATPAGRTMRKATPAGRTSSDVNSYSYSDLELKLQARTKQTARKPAGTVRLMSVCVRI